MTEKEVRIVELAGRHLDGDLDRAEREELLRALSADEAARRTAADLVRLDASLGALGRAYDHAASGATAEAPRPTTVVPLASARRHVMGSSVGGFLVRAAALAACLALGVFIGQSFLPGRGADVARLEHWGAQFTAVSDARSWDHTRTVAPGEAIAVDVTKGGAEAFHLRAEAAEGEINVSILHRANSGAEIRREAMGGRVHYASLLRPVAGDLLIVHNRGTTPVTFHLDTPQPQDATVRNLRI
jgi:anti-sigma factor RsiW